MASLFFLSELQKSSERRRSEGWLEVGVGFFEAHVGFCSGNGKDVNVAMIENGKGLKIKVNCKDKHELTTSEGEGDDASQQDDSTPTENPK